MRARHCGAEFGKGNLCDLGIQHLDGRANASRLKVPREEYYLALGAALRAAALASVCNACLPTDAQAHHAQVLQEVGLKS